MEVHHPALSDARRIGGALREPLDGHDATGGVEPGDLLGQSLALVTHLANGQQLEVQAVVEGEGPELEELKTWHMLIRGMDTRCRLCVFVVYSFNPWPTVLLDQCRKMSKVYINTRITKCNASIRPHRPARPQILDLPQQFQALLKAWRHSLGGCPLRPS